MSKANNLDLQALFTAKLDTYADDEKAAAFFKVGVAEIRKWRTGTGFPKMQACQRLLDEAFTGTFATPKVGGDDLGKLFGDAADDHVKDAVAKLETNGAVSIRIVAMPGDQPEVKVMALDLAAIAAGGAPKAEKDETDTEINPADLGPLKAKVEEKAKPGAHIPKQASEFAIMLPTHRDYPQAVMFSILGNWKATLPEEWRGMLARLDGEPDTLIHVARNVLAHRFMESGAQYAYWQDSDIIATFGNPHWFRKNAGCGFKDDHLSQAAILRLRSRDKTVIAACYSTRNGSGAILAHPNFADVSGPATEQLNEVRKHGPIDKMIETPWFGFGCCLIHRSVFADMQKLPDIPKYPDGSYGYFDPIPGLGMGADANGQQSGEDIAFCKRAKDAGHQPFLDLSLICGHVGRASFMPHV